MIGNTDKETKIDLLTINNTPLHVLAYAGFVIRETGGYWSTEYASALHIPSTSDFVKSFMNPYQSWDEMESIMKNFKSLYNKEFEVFSLSYKDIKNAEYTIDYINYLAITGDSKICKLKSILSGKRIFEDDVEFAISALNMYLNDISIDPQLNSKFVHIQTLNKTLQDYVMIENIMRYNKNKQNRFKMVTPTGDILLWYTSSYFSISVEDIYKIVATVVSYKVLDGITTYVVKNCRFKEEYNIERTFKIKSIID